jgi:E1A/CREB-binding protein
MPNPQQMNMDFVNSQQFRPLNTRAIPKTGTDALMLGTKLFHPDELMKALEPTLMKL